MKTKGLLPSLPVRLQLFLTNHHAQLSYSSPRFCHHAQLLPLSLSRFFLSVPLLPDAQPPAPPLRRRPVSSLALLFLLTFLRAAAGRLPVL